MIAPAASSENVSGSTPRFFGGLIARAGSPWIDSLSTAHWKKPLRIEMFFVLVRGAALAPAVVNELAQALGPERRLKVGQVEIAK